MSAELPLRSLLLWGRWLPAAALLLWLPGHLLAGRHLRSLDAASRVAASLGVGLALAVVSAPLAGAAGVPWRPLPFLAFALALGWGAGRLAAWREAVAAWTDGLPRLPAAGRGLLAATALLGAGLLVAGFGGFSAPPHVHDASNHAFLVLRAVQTGRAGAEAAFAGLSGRPERLYLPSWHAAAALTASLSGVAPYVCAWFFPLALAALLPLSIALLWRAWGLPSVAVVGGALLLTGNKLVPGGILEWGGFGQIVGLFLLPILLLSLRGLWRRPGVATGLLSSLLWAALARAHAGEAYAAVPLALLTWARLPRQPQAPRRGKLALALGLVAVALPALIGPDAWRLGGTYTGQILHEAPAPAARLGYALEQYWKAGGQSHGLQLLTACGLLIALARRCWRSLALVSLALGAVYVARAVWRDPVTALLTVPFYGQAPRVLYLQSLFLPAMAALPLAYARDRVRGGAASGAPCDAPPPDVRPRAGRRGVDWALSVVLLLALAPAWPGVLRHDRLDRGSVPFTPAEYALARRLAGVVPADALIANFWDDGSTWASHVSGRRFLQPLSWPLRGPAGEDLRRVVLALGQRPWPPEVAALRAAGVQYVYVSDRHWPREAKPPIELAAFDADERFQPLLRGGSAALYRIQWDAPPGLGGASAPAPGAPSPGAPPSGAPPQAAP